MGVGLVKVTTETQAALQEFCRPAVAELNLKIQRQFTEQRFSLQGLGPWPCHSSTLQGIIGEGHEQSIGCCDQQQAVPRPDEAAAVPPVPAARNTVIHRHGNCLTRRHQAPTISARCISTAIAMGPPEPPSEFHYARQIKYWRRNLKTYLPHFYTGNDANRMTLALFTVSALDILGDLDGALSAEERQGYVEWVYGCQLPEGGFRPWPGTDFGVRRNEENKTWDPAHIPGTFFALLTLVVLGDDLERVKRREILLWLNKMQRAEGGFGETLGADGFIHGGNDSRFWYMATAIRWILRGDVEGPCGDVPDIRVDDFVSCVCEAESYDGGISEAPYHEAHAGFTSCAIAALSFVDRLPLPPGQAPDGRTRGITNLNNTLHWLASRQTATLEEEDSTDTFDDETNTANTYHDAHSFVKCRSIWHGWA
ncbi:hypothetical protein OPT61_g10060 [Boeremia exigua]|uniref:Uncharacterized protein n=1 Tax=Boeremia exigua TaxID=749465 RepID=A0ACC2HS78_9PLEO|nr:hypothetical protein OPT61_g10060 [Boeremia exigua]